LNQPPENGATNPRLILVTGKGGVGKTTIAGAMALASARKGLRTLVCELKTQGRLPHNLGHSPVGSGLTELEQNLWAVNIDPLRAMEEYGLLKLRFRTLYRLVFDNPLVKALVRFVPGMDDLLMLGKVYNHERDLDRNDAPVWDRIIVDAPATGHSLTFFRLPKVIRDAVPSGNMHLETAEMWALLSDPTKTCIHLVTLPEELPMEESSELLKRLTEELGLPVGKLIVNSTPTELDPSGRQLLDALDTELCSDDPFLDQLSCAGHLRLKQVEMAAPSIKNALAMDPEAVLLPRLQVGGLDRSHMELLADALVKAGVA